ncbi:MAG: protein kinase [Deltaproteobacteria bacterium]|nr:protein kinase [Deltaproteobacteria bacterium]
MAAASPPVGVTQTDLGRTDAQLPERLGPFRIRGMLGKGGMGVVLDAVDERGQAVALKLARPQGDPDRTALVVRRFLRECQILRQLDHPSIVRLVDAGDLDGLLYLAMERIEGVSLLAIRRKGPIELDMAVRLGAQLADALAHMHSHGVLHRDIKPANILVDTTGKPVITDFGISSVEGAQGITRHGDLLGSPGFMPPEVTQGQPQTQHGDQFALGRVLFELVARGPPPKLPLNAPLLQLLAASLKIDWSRFPPESEWDGIRKVLERMLATRPADRFGSAEEARDALSALRLGDLGDFDTISEHVGKLELKPDNPWADEPPPSQVAPRLMPRRPESVERDRLLLDLDKPAGERAIVDPSESSESAVPFELREPSAEDEGEQTDAGIPPKRFKPPAVSDADTNPGALRAQLEPRAPSQKLENPWERPPADDAHRRQELATTLPEVRENYPSEAETKRPGMLKLGSPERRGGAPTEGKPLSEIVANLGQAATPTPAAPNRGPVVVPPAIAPSEKVELSRLQTQLQQLKEQLAESKKLQRPTGLPRKIVGAAAAVGLGLGIGFGWILKPSVYPVPTVVLTPSRSPSEPAFVFKGGEKKQLTETQLKDAWTYLGNARSFLEKQDFTSAERYLKICIEDTNLAECHRTLASLYAVTGNPAARAHLLEYVKAAPDSPDAARIREALE